MTMKKLKQKLTEAPETVQTVTMYYVSLPSEEAHHGHSTGAGVAGYSQRMNSDVAAKLAQIVSEGAWRCFRFMSSSSLPAKSKIQGFVVVRQPTSPGESVSVMWMRNAYLLFFL